MCTVSWFATESGYELFFNRDESRKRLQASPPKLMYSNDVEFISPTDEQAGGSWIVSNEFGITICLLNLYLNSGEPLINQPTSRGSIVRMLADIQQLDQVHSRLNQHELTQFLSFRVFVIDRKLNNQLYIWDGHSLDVEQNVHAPKSSSSVDTQKVVETRKKRFVELGLDVSTDRKDFLEFHRGHEPDKNYSVCVHREHTKTVSLSHIRVSEDRIDFDYYADSPCVTTVPYRTSIDTELDNKVTIYQSDVA